MRRLVLAVVFACVLSGAAQAGEIPVSDRTTPQGSSSVAPGEIPTSDQTTPQLSSSGGTLAPM